MKNLKNIFTLFILVLIASCSKDSDTPSEPIAPQLAISSISPSTGPKNTIVTITGTGFSTTNSENVVTINGKVCPIVNSTATQLTVTIPPSAGSGKIKVTVAGSNAESSNFDFKVTTTVTTIAGSTIGFADGQGNIAQFKQPFGIAIDALENLFVVDKLNHKIRKISSTGLVTTVAGSTIGFADGQGTLAQFSVPSFLVVDGVGNLFVTDVQNNKIRKITPTGLVSTFAGSTQGFADGQGINAQFNDPIGIGIMADGNLLIADANNFRIRKISPTGLVTTLAGGTFGFADGQDTAAEFKVTYGAAADSAGNIFISDQNRIRKISPSGFVSTFAGSVPGYLDGQGVIAQFNSIGGIAIDRSGNLYVTDGNNSKIRKISASGLVTTVAGVTEGSNDGNEITSQFYAPGGITIDNKGNLYVADTGNHRIRKITFD